MRPHCSYLSRRTPLAAGLLGVGTLDGKADRVLRGGLADHDDVDSGVADAGDDGGGDPRDSHHVCVLHVHIAMRRGHWEKGMKRRNRPSEFRQCKVG